MLLIILFVQFCIVCEATRATDEYRIEAETKTRRIMELTIELDNAKRDIRHLESDMFLETSSLRRQLRASYNRANHHTCKCELAIVQSRLDYANEQLDKLRRKGEPNNTPYVIRLAK